MGCSVVNYPMRRHAAGYSSTSSTTDTPAPPLLAKLKGDLKSAMKAKDTPRLNVLRALITEYNNASKTTSPIKTDLELLRVLWKRKQSSEAAVVEANAAHRQDLAQKQLQEIAVIDEYAKSVQVMTEDQIKEAIAKVVQDLQHETDETVINFGKALKELFKAGGVLDGKPADKGQVAKVLKDLLNQRR